MVIYFISLIGPPFGKCFFICFVVLTNALISFFRYVLIFIEIQLTLLLISGGQHKSCLMKLLNIPKNPGPK